MQAVSDQEKNEKIAAWLEPTPTWKYAESEHEDVGVCWMSSDGGCYQRMYIDGRVNLEQCADFLHSEEASAMIVDKLIELGAGIHILSFKAFNPIAGGCLLDCTFAGVLFYSSNYADRKTAIRDACIAWIERGV